MLSQKPDLLFVTRKGVSEAVDENPHFVLSLDFRNPDRIVAVVSPELHREINKQFVKNPELDGVAVGASLSAMVSAACEFLEDDKAIDHWLDSLESVIELLRAFKNERYDALNSNLCDRCNHRAVDHYRPYIGDISCHFSGCSCPEFSPLSRITAKRELRPNLTRIFQSAANTGFSRASKG
jgi:hypothetical protein